jgi:hypothetical protein
MTSMVDGHVHASGVNRPSGVWPQTPFLDPWRPHTGNSYGVCALIDGGSGLTDHHQRAADGVLGGNKDLVDETEQPGTPSCGTGPSLGP